MPHDQRIPRRLLTQYLDFEDVRQLICDHSVNGKKFDLSCPSFVTETDFYRSATTPHLDEAISAGDEIEEELYMHRDFSKEEAKQYLREVDKALYELANARFNEQQDLDRSL